jgi:hypothetical protein
MHSDVKIIRLGDEIALLSQNGGRALLWLLALEMPLLGGLLWQLSAVVSGIEALALPVLGSLALVAWTASHIKPDYRLSLDLATREGRLVRIAAFGRGSVAASFRLEEVECMSLLQTAPRQASSKGQSEYVVAVELRGGRRHVVTARGPILAYRHNVSRFGEAAGIDTRVVRLPTA